jgi:hypothetical protein
VPRAAERAIFNIVGSKSAHVGRLQRADNVEGGNSRERRSERHSTLEASDLTTQNSKFKIEN